MFPSNSKLCAVTVRLQRSLEGILCPIEGESQGPLSIPPPRVAQFFLSVYSQKTYEVNAGWTSDEGKYQG